MSKFKKGSKVKYNKKPGKVIEIINNKIYILLDEPRSISLYTEEKWILTEEYLDVLVATNAIEVIKINQEDTKK